MRRRIKNRYGDFLNERVFPIAIAQPIHWRRLPVPEGVVLSSNVFAVAGNAILNFVEDRIDALFYRFTYFLFSFTYWSICCYFIERFKITVSVTLKIIYWSFYITIKVLPILLYVGFVCFYLVLCLLAAYGSAAERVHASSRNRFYW